MKKISVVTICAMVMMTSAMHGQQEQRRQDADERRQDAAPREERVIERFMSAADIAGNMIPGRGPVTQVEGCKTCVAVEERQVLCSTENIATGNTWWDQDCVDTDSTFWRTHRRTVLKETGFKCVTLWYDDTDYSRTEISQGMSTSFQAWWDARLQGMVDPIQYPVQYVDAGSGGTSCGQSSSSYSDVAYVGPVEVPYTVKEWYCNTSGQWCDGGTLRTVP